MPDELTPPVVNGEVLQRLRVGREPIIEAHLGEECVYSLPEVLSRHLKHYNPHEVSLYDLHLEELSHHELLNNLESHDIIQTKINHLFYTTHDHHINTFDNPHDLKAYQLGLKSWEKQSILPLLDLKALVDQKYTTVIDHTLDHHKRDLQAHNLLARDLGLEAWINQTPIGLNEITFDWINDLLSHSRDPQAHDHNNLTLGLDQWKDQGILTTIEDQLINGLNSTLNTILIYHKEDPEAHDPSLWSIGLNDWYRHSPLSLENAYLQTQYHYHTLNERAHDFHALTLNLRDWIDQGILNGDYVINYITPNLSILSPYDHLAFHNHVEALNPHELTPYTLDLKEWAEEAPWTINEQWINEGLSNLLNDHIKDTEAHLPKASDVSLYQWINDKPFTLNHVYGQLTLSLQGLFDRLAFNKILGYHDHLDAINPHEISSKLLGLEDWNTDYPWMMESTQWIGDNLSTLLNDHIENTHAHLPKASDVFLYQWIDDKPLILSHAYGYLTLHIYNLYYPDCMTLNLENDEWLLLESGLPLCLSDNQIPYLHLEMGEELNLEQDGSLKLNF